MDRLIHKLPGEFIERIKKIYPREYPKILKSLGKPKVSTFRTNLIKIDSHALQQALKENNINFRRVDWSGDAFVLIRPTQREFQDLGLYKQGFVYFQNLSSMLPVILLEFESCERILDLCAAPGGKTTQIVSQTKADVEIIAVEKIKVRFYKLLANLRNQAQEKRVKVKLTDGTRLWRDYEGYFDKVLVDAPCSSEANFLLTNPRSYSYWSYRKIKEAQHKQKRLLFSGIRCLKKGGLLIYSTCTFAPEENEQVINWALGKFKDELYLEPIKLQLSNTKDGLLEWKDKKFSKSLIFTKRIMPTDIMEGFFIAKLRKR